MDLLDLFKLIYQQSIPMKFILYMCVIIVIIKIIMVIQDSQNVKKPLRKHPPSALFFHKEGNKCMTTVGPYEESYLNPAEKEAWHLRKKIKLSNMLRKRREKRRNEQISVTK